MLNNDEKLSESLEDYLEVISTLSDNGAAVRPSDIAAELNVKRPSVTSALIVLAEKGLVEYEKYKPVQLTKEGRKLAERIQKKHSLLSGFFSDFIGVGNSDAEAIACKLEHSIDDSVMRRFVRFIRGLNPCAGCGKAADASCVAECTNPQALPLSSLNGGDRVMVLRINLPAAEIKECAGKGLAEGALVEIVKMSDEEFGIVALHSAEIKLSKTFCNSILVKKL